MSSIFRLWNFGVWHGLRAGGGGIEVITGMDGSQCKRIRLTASNQIPTIYENSFQTMLLNSAGQDATREIDEKIKQLYSGLGEKFKKEDVVAIIIEVMME